MKSVQQKLMARLLPTVLIAIGLGAVLAIIISRSQLEAALEERLLAGGRGTQLELKSIQRNTYGIARNLSQNKHLQLAVMQNNRQKTLELLEYALGYPDVDKLIVLDLKGLVLARGHEPGSYGDKLLHQTSIRKALRNKETQGFSRENPGVAVRVTLPLRHADNIVGVLQLSRLLNYGFLNELKQKYGLDLQIHDGSQIQASTFTESNQLIDAARLASNLRRHIEPQSIKLGDEQFLSLTQVIRDASKKPQGLLLLALSYESTARVGLYLSLTFVGIALLLGVFITFLIVRFSSEITRPLTELVGMTQRLSQGLPINKIKTSGNDEISHLVSSFETMSINLNENRKKLEMAFEELEAFSFSVSHDLRAPLNSINGFTNLLKEELVKEQLTQEERANVYDWFARILASTQKMNTLIHDLLHLARINRFELNREKVDLQALGHKVFDTLTVEDKEQKLTILADEPMSVMGDPTLLEVVLYNLLSNAVKYSHKTPQAKIEFGRKKRLGHNIYYIRDNGAGFPAHLARDLFKPFTRLHNAAEFEGTGIGLSIVKRIVNRHSGRIWANSPENQGAVFYFILP